MATCKNKKRKSYPLVKKAFAATLEHHPTLTVEQAYNAGAALILKTMFKVLTDKQGKEHELLPLQAIDTLLGEVVGFLKKEQLNDTFIA
jgi:hypothetical protein